MVAAVGHAVAVAVGWRQERQRSCAEKAPTSKSRHMHNALNGVGLWKARNLLPVRIFAQGICGFEHGLTGPAQLDLAACQSRDAQWQRRVDCHRKTAATDIAVAIPHF